MIAKRVPERPLSKTPLAIGGESTQTLVSGRSGCQGIWLLKDVYFPQCYFIIGIVELPYPVPYLNSTVLAYTQTHPMRLQIYTQF